MDFIKDLSDDRNKTWCIHCGNNLLNAETSKDHVPSKSLLRRPFPPQIPTVTICQPCNHSFSFDEQYVSTFVACVLIGSTEPDDHPDFWVQARLEKQPELRSLIERSRVQYRTIGGDLRVIWQPDLRRIHRVVVKNARGHAFYEYGEPLFGDPLAMSVEPLEFMNSAQRREFEGCESGTLASWPEVGSRAMQRLMTGQDMIGPWVTVQDGVYRYAVWEHGPGLKVRSVISEYLATEVELKS